MRDRTLHVLYVLGTLGTMAWILTGTILGAALACGCSLALAWDGGL